MSIEHLYLKNFKRFSEQNLDLSRPLNLLVGPNNSGKSTVVKAIAGLKQTVSAGNEHEVLAMQGEYVDLGTYKDIVRGHNSRTGFSIRLTLDRSTSSTTRKAIALSLSPVIEQIRFQIDFGYESTTEQPRIESLTAEITKISSRHKTNLPGGGEHPALTLRRKKTRPSYWLSCNESLLNFVKSHNIFRRQPKDEPPDEAYAQSFESWRSGVSFDHRERYNFVPTQRPQSIVDHLVIDTFDSIINEYAISMDRGVYLLGPLRRSPSRSYTRSSHSLAVGPMGEHTPSVFAILQRKARHSTKGQRQLHYDFEQLREWTSIMFSGRTVHSQTLEELVKLTVEHEEHESGGSRRDLRLDSIMDVGFGFSQVFPILVQMAVMPEGSTLIIEQPELHLHPKAQSQFAYVLAQAIQSGRRFIIETHSEHLIRGLQLAVSRKRLEEKGGISNDDLTVWYIPEDPEPPISIEVNEYGELTKEWPSGFFDEAYRLAFELLENKRKSSKASA